MIESAERFSNAQMRVIQWAAEECQRQRSGELSVACMLRAWDSALLSVHAGDDKPAEVDVLELAALIEPEKNANGYRRCRVRVGADVKGPWEEVPRQMKLLMESIRDGSLNADEAYRSFEQIHPFIDGNGRAGTLLWNWIRGTLGNPGHPPDWDDPVGYWSDGTPSSEDG
jgi:hypothetical protein